MGRTCKDFWLLGVRLTLLATLGGHWLAGTMIGSHSASSSASLRIQALVVGTLVLLLQPRVARTAPLRRMGVAISRLRPGSALSVLLAFQACIASAFGALERWCDGVQDIGFKAAVLQVVIALIVASVLTVIGMTTARVLRSSRSRRPSTTAVLPRLRPVLTSLRTTASWMLPGGVRAPPAAAN